MGSLFPYSLKRKVKTPSHSHFNFNIKKIVIWKQKYMHNNYPKFQIFIIEYL